MTSLSGLGLGLSLVFGCLLLALVAELYYLLWWKKKNTNRDIEEEYSNFTKELFNFICFKKPSSLLTSNTHQQRRKNPNPNANNSDDPDLEMVSSKDSLLKSIGEESVEAELMRLHNLAGPPRFLFTIKEETKEDLESDDGKSRGDRSRKGSRTRSLSDLIMTVDSPFLTPLASPPLKSSPLNSLESFKHEFKFNPLFEPSTETDLTRLRSSPPPKFKFLRDAEEKLLRRLLKEAEKRASQKVEPFSDSGLVKPNPKSNSNSSMVNEDKDESIFTFVVGKNKEKEANQYLPQYQSSSSHVRPLASSPTMFRPLEKREINCSWS